MAGLLQERIKTQRMREEDTDNKEMYESSTNKYNPHDVLTQADIEDLDALNDLASEENEIQDQKKSRKRKLISMSFITVACLYLLVLIYGAIITEYHFDTSGQVAPIIMSASDIKEKYHYDDILGLYQQARELYEEILTLDYRVGQGVEDAMGIAPEYEAALDRVSALSVQIEAATLDSKYNQVKSMLYTIVNTHIAAYCQYMSDAITLNEANAANEALAARGVINDQFQLITQNMVILGDKVKGADIENVKNWSPDGFIKETIEGLL